MPRMSPEARALAQAAHQPMNESDRVRAEALAVLEAHANTLAKLANDAGSARSWVLMNSLNEVLSATERQIEMIR